MGIEIEKKYRLQAEQIGPLIERLIENGGTSSGEEFEENTIYTGPALDARSRVLRIRRVNNRAIFTFKERYVSDSAIKRQREEETGVDDADALAAILDALGYKPALIYEKRRTTWHIANVELVIDELPFGLFVEIEGEEKSIVEAEQLLNLADAEAEHTTYPELARQYGIKRGDVIEARFSR